MPASDLLKRARANPYGTLVLVVFLVAVYLCFVNLDYAALWHDEAPAAFIGKNLLEQGDIVGWDGRNLVGGTNGRTLNDELRDVLPPLMYALNAVGVAIFGFNEIGARSMHALIGVLALGLFWLFLRQHVQNNPRLLFFLFLFVAWSPQLLLYFRQSRYFAFMVFGVVAGFYVYERYWRTRNSLWLAALTLVAVLSFFNHYAAGTAMMCTLAAWHVLSRARETTRREWLKFAACGSIIVAIGLAYLVFMGIIDGERSGYLGFSGVTGVGEYQGATPLALLRIWIYMRELFTADWISWPVFLWFALALYLVRSRKKAKPSSRGKQGRKRENKQATSGATPDEGLPLAAVGRIALAGVLFALFSAMFSQQAVWATPSADLRYYVGALPLLLPMKGLFTEWMWRKSRIAGVAALVVLLFSSAGAAPFNIKMHWTGEPTLGPHLFQFVREIHRPYRDSIREVSDYLMQHAEQDDLVYVAGFAYREALTVRVGQQVLFCCILDRDSPLPRARIEAMGSYLSVEGSRPDWIVVFGGLSNEDWERVKAHYSVAAQLDVHPYPTQRPEINAHAFEPLRLVRGVHILHRKHLP